MGTPTLKNLLPVRYREIIAEQMGKHARNWLQGIPQDSDDLAEALFRIGAISGYERRDGLVLWCLAEMLDFDSHDLDELVALGPKVIQRWLRILKKPPGFRWDDREFLFGEVQRVLKDLRFVNDACIRHHDI